MGRRGRGHAVRPVVRHGEARAGALFALAAGRFGGVSHTGYSSHCSCSACWPSTARMASGSTVCPPPADRTAVIASRVMALAGQPRGRRVRRREDTRPRGRRMGRLARGVARLHAFGDARRAPACTRRGVRLPLDLPSRDLVSARRAAAFPRRGRLVGAHFDPGARESSASSSSRTRGASALVDLREISTLTASLPAASTLRPRSDPSRDGTPAGSPARSARRRRATATFQPLAQEPGLRQHGWRPAFAQARRVVRGKGARQRDRAVRGLAVPVVFAFALTVTRQSVRASSGFVSGALCNSWALSQTMTSPTR